MLRHTKWMNLSGNGIPITTRRIVMHKSIQMSESSLTLTAFGVSEFRVTPNQPHSAIIPQKVTEKLLTVAGTFNHAGQSLKLTLHRKLLRDEIAQSLARINTLNEFFSDVGRRFEAGTETLLPLFDGLEAGFRKIDLKTTGTVFIFEQEEARCELVSSSVAEMTFLRDGLGNILNL